MDKKITHINKDGHPQMVDVSDKNITTRTALASGKVLFPAHIFEELSNDKFLGKKGSIIQTSIIAGIQAVKKTSDLIPLCHPLPVSKVNIEIKPGINLLEIICEVRCTSQTGVEMEALTGVSVAALTVYDMTKALSHDIQITDIKLNSKKGGKSDYEN